MAAGSKARFTLEQAVKDYLRPGSDEYKGCDALVSGGALNVNIPSEKRLLQAALRFGFPAIVAGMKSDGHLNHL